MNVHRPFSRIADRYEVAGRPLVGGMGIVYLCFDHQEQRPVALKTFKPEFLPDRAARERFLEEGNTWVRLGKHPHVVRAYSVERIGDGREVYLVLELVAKEEGRRDASLRSWLTPGKALPADQALLITLQIVRGMRHAVATIPGFVHRDLKPENVLVGADRLSNAAINRVRITDFGLMRGLRAEQAPAATAADLAQGLLRLTRVGSIVGTPPYMAPEQWERADVDVQADIYALGCILGEMLIGSMLVQGGTMNEVRRAHKGGQAMRAVQSVPDAVRDLLAECLAVEPSRRYPDWATLEATLAAMYGNITSRPAPKVEVAGALNRAERIAAGWAASEIEYSYVDIGKADAALGYFERARQAGHVEGEPWLEAGGLNYQGLAHARLGDTRRAIGYCEQALAIYGELRAASTESSLEWTAGRHGESVTLGNLGNAYRQLGDVRRAIGYYEQVLVIHRQIRDRHSEGADLGNLGSAYSQLGDARRAIGYLEQALAIWREIGDRRGEGTDLGNLGNAYADLDDVRRAIGYHEQALTIHREIGDVNGVASSSLTMAVLLVLQGDAAHALLLAREAARLWSEMGHVTRAQRAQQAVARLEGSGGAGAAPSSSEILHQFTPLIDTAVAAIRGDRNARRQIEDAFNMLTQSGSMIADPIRRIWAGERNEAALTAGIDPNSALIVCEIIRRL